MAYSTESDPAMSRDLTLPEAFAAVAAHRRVVLGGAVAGTVLGVVLAFTLRPVYESEVVLAYSGKQGSQLGELAGQFSGLASIAGMDLAMGGDGERNTAIATLKSYRAVASFIEQSKIGEIVLQETSGPAWLPKLGGGGGESVWETVRRFRKHLGVEEKKPGGLIVVSVQWYDAQSAADWANAFARHADGMLRKKALDRSTARLEFLRGKFETTPYLAVREAISKLIESELRTVTLASADDEFAFQIIDPAIAAERHARPRRALMIVLLGSLGAFAGVVSALFRALRRKQL
jgi:uncharacterized protein involved in exopolysaccharide biosynthesis